MMTRDDVKDVLGPIDEATVADIVRTGAERAELVEALAWMASDDALMRDGRSRPGGLVARLVDILEAEDEAFDAPAFAPAGADHQAGAWE